MESVAMKGCTRKTAVTHSGKRARGRAHGQAGRHHFPGGPIPMDGHFRAAHRRQRQQTAHRQINAAGNDDQGHAAGQHAIDGRLAKGVAMGADFEKRAVGVEDDAREPDQQQSQQGAPGRTAQAAECWPGEEIAHTVCR